MKLTKAGLIKKSALFDTSDNDEDIVDEEDIEREISKIKKKAELKRSLEESVQPTESHDIINAPENEESLAYQENGKMIKRTKWVSGGFMGKEAEAKEEVVKHDEDLIREKLQEQVKQQDGENDELEEFMENLKNNETVQEKGDRDFEEEEDPFEYLASLPVEENQEGDIQEFEDESDLAKKKEIDPLPPINHDEITYAPFEKDLYEPHEDVKNLTEEQIKDLRTKIGVSVSGIDSLISPCPSFAMFNFPEQLLNTIRKNDFTTPTPIQQQAIPIILSGRDIIAISKTGSGKTAAFVWPAIIHILHQDKQENGPIVLIIAPTRELVQQLYNETKKYTKRFKISVVPLYGGASKTEQYKALSETDIVISTPGRLIDMIKIGATNLKRVTFLVLDEADRSLDLGFETQVRSICNNVRPDRQTLLFSATFRNEFSADVLIDPVRISVGAWNGLTLNEKVEHKFITFEKAEGKWEWLERNLRGYLDAIEGSMIIFVSRKEGTEQLAQSLNSCLSINCLSLHGDMYQYERDKVLGDFKSLKSRVLVATDVAARGLDVNHVRFIINYDPPRDIDSYIHRIGRTGRLSTINGWERDLAISFLTDADYKFAYGLVKLLTSAGKSNKNIKWSGLEEVKEIAKIEYNRKAVKTKVKNNGNNPRLGLGFTTKSLNKK